MTRVLRVLFIVVMAIIAIAGAIAAYVALTFTPKDYLPMLTAAVREATGRELRSDGRIGLKLFPCCAVTLGETSLGNPAGFRTSAPPGDFARVRSAAVSLKLWPLIVRREVQVGTVHLDGLAVELRERADGSTSWDFGSGGATQTTGSNRESTGAGGGAFTASGLDIRAATVHYHSDKSGADYLVRDLKLNTGELTVGKPVRLDVAFQLTSAALPGGSLDATVGVRELIVIRGDSGAMLANIDGLDAKIRGLGAALRIRGRGGVGGATGTRLSGQLELEPVSPRSVFAALKKDPPATSDPKALTRLSGRANWLLQPAAAELSALDVQLDQTHVTGSLRLPQTGNAPLAFDLHVDKLDADRYRGGEEGAAADRKPAPDTPDSELPLDTLRALHLDGRVQVAELTWSKLRMKDVTTHIQAAGGRLRLDPLRAALYDGTLAGSVSVDASGPAARVAVDQRLSAFKVGPALRDIYKSDKLDGVLSASLDVSGTGRTAHDVLRSLAGPVSVHLTNGTYRGADLWYEIRRARALLKRTELPARPAEPATPIDSLTLEGTAKDGVLHTTQFGGRMPFTVLSGEGAFDLADDTLDCHLTAKVVETPKFADGGDLTGFNGIAIPLTLKGAMGSPKVGVDFGSLAQSVVTEEAEKKLKEKLLKKFGNFLRQ